MDILAERDSIVSTVKLGNKEFFGHQNQEKMTSYQP